MGYQQVKSWLKALNNAYQTHNLLMLSLELSQDRKPSRDSSSVYDKTSYIYIFMLNISIYYSSFSCSYLYICVKYCYTKISQNDLLKMYDTFWGGVEVACRILRKVN